MIEVIGLTGGIATGKSTVANMFKDNDIPVIDTDKISRELLVQGTDAYNELLEYFGTDIVMATGHVNRKKLAKKIFENPIERKKLNDIIHPRVRKNVLTQIKKYEVLENDIVILDVPLLFESGFDDLASKIICVYADFSIQVERLCDRDEIETDYALTKINSQMDINEKKEKSDFIIDNSDSIIKTKKQFNEVLEKIKKG